MSASRCFGTQATGSGAEVIAATGLNLSPIILEDELPAHRFLVGDFYVGMFYQSIDMRRS